jgi:hypothetical protein
MTSFVNSNECLLRDYSIKNYVNNSIKETLKKDIMEMISEYNDWNNTKRIDIHNEFPIDKLIKIMKPYLYLYVSGHYSLMPNYKQLSRIILNKKLCEFQKFNPKFGRKIYVIKYILKNNGKKAFIKSVKFIDEHKKFYNINNDNFNDDHLTYKYNDGNNDFYEEDENDDENNNMDNHLNDNNHFDESSQEESIYSILDTNEYSTSIENEEEDHNEEYQEEEEEEDQLFNNDNNERNYTSSSDSYSEIDEDIFDE